MTKKDYEKIAETIHTLGVQTREETIYRDDLLDKLSIMFKKDNPNFDRVRFVLAATRSKE